jgi:hypothetical protein
VTQTSLPAARAAFTDPSGRPTPQFYRFLETLATAQAANPDSADIAAINAQLAAIQAEIDALPAGGSYPTLRVLAPLVSEGLLQNGFAQLSWDGTTDDVPEGTTNLYYTAARVDAEIAAHATFPFFAGDGSEHNIPLTSDLKLPFFASNGAAANIPLAA